MNKYIRMIDGSLIETQMLPTEEQYSIKDTCYRTNDKVYFVDGHNKKHNLFVDCYKSSDTIKEILMDGDVIEVKIDGQIKRKIDINMNNLDSIAYIFRGNCRILKIYHEDSYGNFKLRWKRK